MSNLTLFYLTKQPVDVELDEKGCVIIANDNHYQYIVNANHYQSKEER